MKKVTVVKLYFVVSAVLLLFPAVTFGAPDSVEIFGAYVSRNSTSVTVSWNTTPHTKAYVSYAGTDGVWTQTPWSTQYLAKHELTLLQLHPETTYLYRIQVEAEDGNYSTYSGTFTTLAPLGSTTEESQNVATSETSFQNLLSPSPSPQIFAPNAQQIPQNIQYIPYYIPFQLGVTPSETPAPNSVLGSLSTPSPTQPQTNEPSILASDQSVVFVLGLLVGIVLVTLATHSFSGKHIQIHESTHTQKPKRTEYTLKVKN